MAEMTGMKMRYKQSLDLWLFIVAVIVSVLISLIGSQATESGQLASNNLVLIQGCMADSEVSAAVKSLSFGETYEDQQKAVTLLKDNANRSSACRKQVITNLISAMDQPNLDLTGGTPQFFLWHYGTKLLGELKAVEAMDLLIANFLQHDGSGFPLNHYPALGGAIHMGEVALPKLQSALKEHPDRYIRRHVVFCIALIGGKSAHQILREALPGESDPCVASCIRATLVEFDNNKRRPHQISDVGRTTWYSTFLCNGE